MATSGMFDDLIPKNQGSTTSTGLFDDLIPKKKKQEAMALAPVSRGREYVEPSTPESINKAAKAGHDKSRAMRKAREAEDKKPAPKRVSVNAPASRVMPAGESDAFTGGGTGPNLVMEALRGPSEGIGAAMGAMVKGVRGAGVAALGQRNSPDVDELNYSSGDVLGQNLAYVIPGYGPLLGLGGLADTVGTVAGAKDKKKALLDIAQAMNPAAPGLDPLDRVVRGIGAVTMAAGAGYGVAKGAPKIVKKLTPDVGSVIDEALGAKPKPFDLSKPVDNVPREAPPKAPTTNNLGASPRAGLSSSKEPWGLTRKDASTYINSLIQEAEVVASKIKLPAEEWTSNLKESVAAARKEYETLQRQWDAAQMPSEALVKRLKAAKERVAELEGRAKTIEEDTRANRIAKAKAEADYLLSSYPELFTAREDFPFYVGSSRFSEFNLSHKQAVKQALADGKPVPQEVLADYPEFQTNKSPELPKSPVTPQQQSSKVIEQGKAASENTALFNRFQEAEGTAVKPTKGTKKGQSTAKGQELAKDLSDDAILTRSKEIAEGNRPHSAEEVGLMLEGKRRLLKTANDLKAKLDEKPGDPELLTQYAKAQGDLDTLVQNVQKGKGAWSDTGRALQEGVNVNTADFADVMAEYRRVGGKTNPKLEAELNRATSRIKELEDTIAAKDAARDFAPAEKAVGDLTLKINRNPSRTVEHIRTEKAEAIGRIKERIQQAANEAKGKASSDPTGVGQLSEFVKAVPDVARDLRRVVELVIEEYKVTKLDAHFYEKAREDLNQIDGLKDADITDADIRKVLSGRLEPKTAHTTSEATRRLNDLKKQAGLIDDIEGAKAGKAPKTGAKVPSASMEVQRLRAQLNDLLKAMGKGPAHEAVKTRLRGMIAELEGELKGNYRLIKNAPKPKPLDVGNLRNEVATLRRKLGLDDEIARLEDQLRTGEFEVKGKTKRIYDKQETAQRAELDKLKTQVKARLEAAKPRTKAQKVEGVLSNFALFNPVARGKDLGSNTVKVSSYVAQNPGRVLIGKAVGKLHTEGFRGTEQLLTPSKLSRIFEGYATRVKDQLETAIKTGDVDSIAKYGTPNLGSKLAGATDIPFKEFYFRHALDDLAVEVAKGEKLTGKNLDKRVRELHLDPTPEMVEIAHEWALRQTFNIENVAGNIAGSVKQSIKKMGSKMGPRGESFATVTATILETPVRFSKVIGNVALENVNYSPAGLAEAVGRTLITGKKGYSPGQARLIADLAMKGLTGTALYFLGKSMQDAPEPELVKTKSGQYLDWGEWMEILGGPLRPLLAGWSEKYIDKSGLTESQKNKLRWENGVNLIADQPLVSGGIEQTSRALQSENAAAKFAGGVGARALIPSAVREWAKRQDAAKAGNIFKERRVESTGPLTEVMKNLPFAREQLPNASSKRETTSRPKSTYKHTRP